MGLPNSYMLLNQDQQDFVDAFDFMQDFDLEKVKQQMQDAVSLVHDLDVCLEQIGLEVLGE